MTKKEADFLGEIGLSIFWLHELEGAGHWEK